LLCRRKDGIGPALAASLHAALHPDGSAGARGATDGDDAKDGVDPRPDGSGAHGA